MASDAFQHEKLFPVFNSISAISSKYIESIWWKYLSRLGSKLIIFLTDVTAFLFVFKEKSIEQSNLNKVSFWNKYLHIITDLKFFGIIKPHFPETRYILHSWGNSAFVKQLLYISISHVLQEDIHDFRKLFTRTMAIVLSSGTTFLEAKSVLFSLLWFKNVL